MSVLLLPPRSSLLLDSARGVLLPGPIHKAEEIESFIARCRASSWVIENFGVLLHFWGEGGLVGVHSADYRLSPTRLS